MNSNSICEIHNKSLKFICFDCNVLTCSICSTKHFGHSCEHIFNIKSKINNNNKTDPITDESEVNNNHNNNNNSVREILKDVQTGIQSTFDSLKLKVKEYEKLKKTEHEISSEFKELHEFLVVEEHKLKKPIIDSKEQTEQQIEKQVKIMKSLNSINNHFTNHQSDSQSSSSSSSQPIAASADTVERYQISTIIESISQSSNHNEFISNNSNTLFHFDTDSSKKVNNDDLSLLNVLLEHNKTIKMNNCDDNQPSKSQQYQLIVDNDQINKIKNQFQSSFKLKSNQSHIIQPKQSYIFSTDKNNKISIINITDRNNIHFEQQIKMEMKSSFAVFNSIVKVKDFIYIFGGANFGYSKFIKYSINTKTLVINEMKGVDHCQFLSACYDGQDHIYLLDGVNKFITEIYRYEINNSAFEKYSTMVATSHQILTFIFKDYIYTVSGGTKKILMFDIRKKTAVELQLRIPGNNVLAACTDGGGNIFMVSELGLQRINIETHEIKLFDNSIIGSHSYHDLVYHQSNDGQSFIYSIQGKRGNLMFSLENKKWESILQDDQCVRTDCATLFFQQ
ncbi:hypothetical protein PPL_10457 [Heterostelium album PN500]|uniref:B box-type domain-containing protein n=1 Tax=Heterostelium pallidum (strain ATCC 26659 / Pp 5 / PN500) TaxID=670386 RepID=D3BR53_HETP5|nr:hypothetical protein PPL_10457 [Heterostelium album PN500]EFA75885.1 hypothetical protein PPL_10457 [Heterostelium album PN500]|eukprot:XP_020428019.1 hypothetical protein PPL_10457 [Heterostelium album PN500]